MIVLWGIVIGVVVGFIRGGNLENLGSIRFRALWLVFAALGLQFLIFPTPWWSVPAIVQTSAIPHVLSYVMLATFLVLNRSIPSIWIIVTGGLMNIAVIVANRGYMPTNTDNLAKSGNPEVAKVLSETPGTTVGNVIAMSDTTRLNLLADRFYLPQWVPFGTSFSIGDFVLAIGMVLLITRCMKDTNGVE